LCDPDNLILETIAAANYAGKEINVLSPECVGDRCPEPLTSAKVFVNTIGRCEESDGATGSARGVEEWCKISPLIVGEGINFIFNNLLDPTSVELVRKQLTNPQALRGLRLEDPDPQDQGPDHPLQRRLYQGHRLDAGRDHAVGEPLVHPEPRRAGCPLRPQRVGSRRV
jgi:hypothetical protein